MTTKSTVFNIIFNYNEPNLTMSPHTNGNSRKPSALTELMIGFCRRVESGGWRTRWYNANRRTARMCMAIAPLAQANMRGEAIKLVP